MCGLAGVVGTGVVLEDRDIFRQLLFVSQLRGIHSTGVAVLANNKIRIEKDAISPAEFLKKDADRKTFGLMDNFNTDMMMGHARWATVGKVTKENAHPFENHKYIGAHNGTLVDYRFHQNDLTDSQNLFNEMNDNGICETLKNLLPDSAYALSIYDKYTGKLWLGRNKHRTLFIAQAKFGKVLYWASELEMLRLVLGRNQIDAEYRVLTPNIMYEIDINRIDNFSKCETPWIAHDCPPKEAKPPIIRPFVPEKESSIVPEYKMEKKKTKVDDEWCSSCCKHMSLADQINGYSWVDDQKTKLFICEPCLNRDTSPHQRNVDE